MTVETASSGLDTLSKAFNLVVKDDKAAAKVNGHSNGETSEVTNGEKETNGHAESAKVADETTEEEKKEEQKEEKTEPDVPVGSIGAVTNIYWAKDSEGNWNWTSKYPEDAVEAAENDETAKYALVLRSQTSTDSRKKLQAHSIVIQSPQLKVALGEILADYPGVSCDLERLVFRKSFEPFLHRWSDLVAYLARDDLDKTTKDHLTLLHSVLSEELRDEIKAYEDYLKKGVTTFEHAWMLFQPGILLVSESLGPISAYELRSSEVVEGRCGSVLQLQCEVVNWSGSEFGRTTQYLSISEFKGTQRITNLPAFPFAFHPNQEALKAILIERGRRFEALAGHHFKSYKGVAISWDNNGNEIGVHHDGRIVIDCKAFDIHSPYATRSVHGFSAKDKAMLTHKNKKARSRNPLKQEPVQEDESEYILSDYHLLLAYNRLRGYSIASKKWMDFFVEFVDEIVWNSRAFDSLVLPPDQKELILAFTESQVLNREGFDDIVSGKGQGIIILLSGKPGIGKTLTAESVAEAMKRPLHTISSGDLGTNATDIEYKLNKILELVGRWNAVLLLDECDVFLEARSTHDLERNALVSTFLRTLEYYNGILFMTTNRADNIDPAFDSRIHVSMQYPDLTSDSRRKIWSNFLAVHNHNLTDADLDELAEIDLNGRQIKNILKTSHLLASRRKQKLGMKDVSTVLSIENRRPEKLKRKVINA